MNYTRQYVNVRADFYDDGRIMPLEVHWEDGRVFPIDRVVDIRPSASLKVGGAGIRYTCRIGKNETYLFLDDNKWFVEKKLGS